MEKEKLNDLLEQWIVFREEELAELTNKNKRLPLKFEKYANKLVQSLPYKSRKYIRIVLFYNLLFLMHKSIIV